VAIWVFIVINLLGDLALLVGFKTRWAAASLAFLCPGTAFGVRFRSLAFDFLHLIARRFGIVRR
jgi:uncharacterized membrane protein YphA (DoxX/SURF4 family)